MNLKKGGNIHLGQKILLRKNMIPVWNQTRSRSPHWNVIFMNNSVVRMDHSDLDPNRT